MFMQSFDEAIAIGLTRQRLTAWMAGLAGGPKTRAATTGPAVALRAE